MSIFSKKKRSAKELKAEILKLQNELDALGGSSNKPSDNAPEEADNDQAANKDNPNALSQYSEVLFSTLSHELRTPLNGVLGLAQLMRDEMSDNEQLETLESSARHMQSVIHTIVNFSKIQGSWGNLPSYKAWLNVHDLLNQFAKNLRARASARNLKIVVNHQDKKLTLRADMDHLTNIIECAILGSIECTKIEKGNKINTLNISWFKEDEFIKVRIENPMEVMPDNRGERIADVSSMTKGTQHKSIRMEFLYWAVSSSLLEHYNGAMLAMPMEGGQGVVTTLAFTMESMNASESVAKPVGGLSLSTGKKESPSIFELPFKKRLLLVEDDPVSKGIMTFLLKRIGQEAVAVDNGQEALDMLTSGEKFDLILMDIDMPILDGISTTQAIRIGECGEECKDIPIAATTAFSTLSDHSKFKKAGMNFTTSKPVSMNELRSILFEVDRMETKKLKS
jgi:CheY-like chemotaxis protein